MRRNRLRLVVWATVTAAVVAGGAGVVVQTAPLGRTGTPEVVLGERMPFRGDAWLPFGTPISYPDHPPATGQMFISSAPAGVYSDGLAPGYWLHSLHQGYVALLYKPPVSKPMLWLFQVMVWTFPRSQYGTVKLVVAPYSEMPHQFALVAWGWRLWMDQFDVRTVLAFYRAHFDRGPEPRP